MKSPEQLIYFRIDNHLTLDELIPIIQKEAWNEAIEAAANVVKYNQKTNKDLILKLRK